MDRNRLSRTLFIAAACGAVVALSKGLSLPETALSAYLIFFATRTDATQTAAVAAALSVAALVAIGLTIVLVMATAGAPALRIATMFAVACAAMYAAQATSAGIVAATIGMAMFEVLSVLDYLAYPDLLLRGLFWLLTVVFVPMGVLLVAALLFGAGASERLQEVLRQRLAAIGTAIATQSACSRAACRALALRGDGAALATWTRLARLSGRVDAAGAARAGAVIAATDRLLVDCAAGRFPENTPEARRALTLDAGASPADARLAALIAPAAILPGPPTAEPTSEVGPAPAIRFALKATLSIALCYALFTLLDWPAIHTITITAFLVCLGSTGETLHKASLRIAGCLFGAALSFFALLVVVPNLTGIGGLAILTTLALLPAAWIATGSERVAYAGMQMALVFLLSVVNTPGPDVDLGVTWGRIVGILLGNLVVAVVFLTVWPTSLGRDARESVARAAEAVRCNRPGEATDALARARDMIFALRFEPGAEETCRRIATDAAKVERALFDDPPQEATS